MHKFIHCFSNVIYTCGAYGLPLFPEICHAISYLSCKWALNYAGGVFFFFILKFN